MNLLNLYTFLKNGGFKVTSFNSDNNTIRIEDISTSEIISLVAGLNYSTSIRVTIQLTSMTHTHMPIYNLVVIELD